MVLLSKQERQKMKEEILTWEEKRQKLNSPEDFTDPAYIRLVEDILRHKMFTKMASFIQHGKTSTRTHCMQVSYLAYCLALKLGLDAKACARAGLLHDMFLYDWHGYHRPWGVFLPHGFTHPKVALYYASRYFKLTPKEKNMILRHMWPLTFLPPRYKEGYLLVLADKYCALAEMGRRIARWAEKKKAAKNRVTKKKKG